MDGVKVKAHEKKKYLTKEQIPEKSTVTKYLYFVTSQPWSPESPIKSLPSATSGRSCWLSSLFMLYLFWGADICVFSSRGTVRENKLLAFSISSHLSGCSVALLCISAALGLGPGSTVAPLGPIRRYTSRIRLAEQILPSAAVPALHGRSQRGRGKVAVTQGGGEVTDPV